MSKSIKLSAARFRLILLIALPLAIAVVIAVIVYGVQTLNTTAAEVNVVVREASTEQERIQGIRQQINALREERQAVDLSRRLLGEEAGYQYQNDVIRDLEALSTEARVTVESYDFTGSNSEGADATPTPEPTPEATEGIEPDASASPQPGTPPPVGPKSTTINVTIQNPVRYENFLRFIHLIEQNPTKMQIGTISISPAENDSEVTSNTLEIEVYLR